MGNPWGNVNNEKRPKGNVLDMKIYVALTLLHAPDLLNMLLNDHLTSSDPLQSKFCTEFPTCHKKYIKGPGINLGCF